MEEYEVAALLRPVAVEGERLEAVEAVRARRCSKTAHITPTHHTRSSELSRHNRLLTGVRSHKRAFVPCLKPHADDALLLDVVDGQRRGREGRRAGRCGEG